MTAGSKNTGNVHVLRSGKVVGKAEVQRKVSHRVKPKQICEKKSKTKRYRFSL